MSQPPSSALVAADLHKSFGTRSQPVPVLNGVACSFPAGSFTAVMGASGSGKTTLLLTLGGLRRPDTGTVRFGDEDIYAAGPDRMRRRTGFLFQRFHLLPYLTIRENILLGSNPGSPDAGTEADRWIDHLGLQHRRNHRPGRLSVGEQQRTALARALVRCPAVLLADEPCGNLDESNANLVLDALARRAAEGAIVVMVTHDRAAARHATRTLRLEAGTIREA